MFVLQRIKSAFNGPAVYVLATEVFLNNDL